MVVGVFFDTNFVDNRKSAQSFWGGREALEKIGKRVKLLAPRVVHDEVEHHIKKYLEAQKSSLKINPYKHFLSINDTDIDRVSIDSHVKRLIDDEIIEYEIVDLGDEMNAYKKAYKHAIEGITPFETEKDKGFKDTLIACTIDQYCKKLAAHDFVFFLTADEQLRKYFKNSRKVHAITTYEEFDAEYSKWEVDKALLERIRNFLIDEGVGFLNKIKLDDQWLNYEGDLIVKVHEAEKDLAYSVLVDVIRKEPVSFTQTDLGETVSSLAMAEGVYDAERAASDFSDAVEYLSVGKVNMGFDAFKNNENIWLAGGETSILQAAADLYKALSGFSMDKEAEEVKERHLGLNMEKYDD